MGKAIDSHRAAEDGTGGAEVLLPKDGVRNREDRGRSSDGEGQGEDGREGKPKAAPQAAGGIAAVVGDSRQHVLPAGLADLVADGERSAGLAAGSTFRFDGRKAF